MFTRALARNSFLLAAVVVAVSAGGATAGALLTGTSIKNESLSGADVRNSSLTGLDLKNRSLTGVDLKNGALSGVQVQDGSLTGGDLQDGSLTGGDLQDGTVSASDIADGSLSTSDIADGSLTGADIKDASVASADIEDGSVTGTDLKDGSIASTDLEDGSVTSPDIKDGTITFADLDATAQAPRAFARVQADGTVEPGVAAAGEVQFKDIEAADVQKAATGIYCFGGLPFTVHSAVVSLDNAGLSNAGAPTNTLLTSVAIQRGNSLGTCDATHQQARVMVTNVDPAIAAAVAADARFTIWFA